MLYIPTARWLRNKNYTEEWEAVKAFIDQQDYRGSFQSSSKVTLTVARPRRWKHRSHGPQPATPQTSPDQALVLFILLKALAQFYPGFLPLRHGAHPNTIVRALAAWWAGCTRADPLTAEISLSDHQSLEPGSSTFQSDLRAARKR